MTRNLVRGTIILCVFGANGFAAWQQPVFRGASTKTSPEIFPQRVTRIGKTGQAENPTRGPCHMRSLTFARSIAPAPTSPHHRLDRRRPHSSATLRRRDFALELVAPLPSCP
jgi:hypothetical protein